MVDLYYIYRCTCILYIYIYIYVLCHLKIQIEDDCISKSSTAKNCRTYSIPTVEDPKDDGRIFELWSFWNLKFS